VLTVAGVKGAGGLLPLPYPRRLAPRCAVDAMLKAGLDLPFQLLVAPLLQLVGPLCRGVEGALELLACELELCCLLIKLFE